jgi:hypothetical protein
MSLVQEFRTAIAILDQSETEVRDLIERGVPHPNQPDAHDRLNDLITKVKAIRVEAIKSAFRHIRDTM